MTKKDEIISLYYDKKLKATIISEKVNVSTAYITKVIKNDFRYQVEKNRRKEESKNRQRQRNINCIKKNRKIKKAKNERLDAFMEMQHRQASGELSGRRTINNRAFKKWNSSIYDYHNRTKEFRLKEELKNKTSYAIPKKIKWK